MQKLGDWLKQRFEAVVGVVVSLPGISSALVDYHAIPRADRREPGRRPQPASETAVIAASLVLTVLVAIIDCRSVERVSFILFYLLIAAYGAWAGGRRAGVWITLASALGSFVNEVSHKSQFGVLCWNLGVQIGILLFAVLLVSAVRTLTAQLEHRVAERTAALQREVAERVQTEEQLRKTMQQLRQLAENITDAFWMRDAEDTRMVYVSPAFEKIWGRSCRELYQAPNGWLDTIHLEDRGAAAEAFHTQQVTGEYNQQYRIVRPDGGLRWIRDRAFPIRDSSGKVVRVVGIAEDITDRRRLEREILEISDREQARIGQDLHDGLCQQLVSLGFDNHSLEQRLAAREGPEAADVRKMGELIDDAITEARALSHGLFPVQLEADGLRLALQQLADGASSRSRIRCRLECPQPVSVRDNTVATHLYRIAQEAVNNAIKHSRGSSIVIQLKTGRDRLELNVSDNGIGPGKASASAGGLGLHIMKYRAQTIGGTLKIEPAPGRGTSVSCCAQQPLD